MALSYTINSGSKLLIVSSLLASSVASVAFATESATSDLQNTKSQKKESQKKTKDVPIGSNEVSADVAEQLFIEMQQKMQQEEIEKLSKELASLKPSEKERRESLTHRLAELKSTVSYQYAHNSNSNKAKNTKNKAKPSALAQKKSTSPKAVAKPTTKPKFAVKIKPLKTKPQINSRINNEIDPIASYKTAQINNATIKRLTNKNHLVIGRQAEVESTVKPIIKPIVKPTVKPAIKTVTKPTETMTKPVVKPVTDKKGELLALEPASVNVEHEFQPVVIKPKISKLKVKPHKKVDTPKTTTKISTKANIKVKQPVKSKADSTNRVTNKVKVSKLSVSKPVTKSVTKTTEKIKTAKSPIKAVSKKTTEKQATKSSASTDMPNTMASELYLEALQAFSVEETNTARRVLSPKRTR